MGEENEQPRKRAYLNQVPLGYGAPRCEYPDQSEGLAGKRCGLPAWDDAPETREGDPRCEFHSRSNPEDIRQRLETAAGLTHFGTCLYFSFVTFTTLGYGDVRPCEGWGRVFASAEAVFGFLLMSLFLVCFVRKFSR